jgi:DcmR-like sensory protein
MNRVSAREGDARFVQFADPDAVLIAQLGRAMSATLVRGNAVVCIATDAHRRLLESRLRRGGTDLRRARRAQQYVYLDAIDSLARVTVDGSPDVVRFAEVIGAPIDRVAARFPQVWIFGDMVALMCAYGNRAGAIRLERLWRSLNEARPVFRYCAYPPNVYRPDSLGGNTTEN